MNLGCKKNECGQGYYIDESIETVTDNQGANPPEFETCTTKQETFGHNTDIRMREPKE